MCGHPIHKGEADPSKAIVVERQSGILVTQLGAREPQPQIMIPPITKHVTVSMLINFSGLQFLFL